MNTGRVETESDEIFYEVRGRLNRAFGATDVCQGK